MSVTGVLISPTSRELSPLHHRVAMSLIYDASTGGNIKLASSDPFAKPLINPNYLSTAFDIFTIRESIKAIKRFVSAKAWAGFVIAPFGGLANTNTDAQIDAYVKNSGATIFHAVGTASMSPKGAKWGVVDPDLTVKGVEGIRVADGSILVSGIMTIQCQLTPVLTSRLIKPYAPNSHTQGPIYLVGERAADLIKSCPRHH